MATPLNTIKNWFKTGLKPTQTQFWAMFDSFWHKAEEIPTSSINGLDDTLDNKVDKASYDIEQQEVANALVTIGEDVTGKVDKVDGKGLSTNDFTNEAEQTVTDAEAHLNNNDIHVTADQKKTYANKLKAYVAGEVIEDVLGDVFRISDNKIYSLNAALPYTTNDIIAETVNGDWTIELEAPEAGLTFKDADGIDQFSGSFALFEGFGFDAATKKIINKTSIFDTFFIDTVNGNNSTGQKNDTDFAFASLDGALNFYKANEPLVGSVSEKNYLFQLVSSGSHTVSQKLVQAVDPNINIANKKGTNIFIKSDVIADLNFIGSPEISCFLSNEGQSGNDSNNAFNNTLLIDMPLGNVTLSGAGAGLGSTNQNPFFDNQVNIKTNIIRHNSDKTFCSFGKEGYGLRAKYMYIESTASTLIFSDVSNRKKIIIENIIATSPFTFMRFFKDGSEFEFKNLNSNSDFILTYGFNGHCAGTIIHGNVDYSGSTSGMFYLSSGGRKNGESDLKLHFPSKSIIKGDVRITGNSSNANITFSGEQAIYEDCTRLFNQIDHIVGKTKRIRFDLKKIFVFGDVGSSFINTGIVLNNCFVELGGILIKSPISTNANQHVEDFDLLTVEGVCVVKANQANGNVVFSGDQINGTSAKVKINGDLLMLDGAIEENENLEVLKTVNINRY